MMFGNTNIKFPHVIWPYFSSFWVTFCCTCGSYKMIYLSKIYT